MEQPWQRRSAEEIPEVIRPCEAGEYDDERRDARPRIKAMVGTARPAQRDEVRSGSQGGCIM
jgi:hypothetical protein